MPRMPEDRYTCPDCHDTRWVDIVHEDLAAPRASKPCARCNPVQWERAHGGHYAVDHTCPECSAIRSGSVTRYDFNEDGRLQSGVL